MSDYWDYLKENFSNPLYWTPGTFLTSAYETAYENSHGSDRYLWSKVPILSQWKKLKDSAKEAQDYYDNTGQDPTYANHVRGPGFESLYGASAAGAGAVKMARSLGEMYSPEVIEDVGSKFNGMYR